MINHSCDPNLAVFQVYVDFNNIPRVALFANRDILPFEEFTIDYSYTKQEKQIPCLCGASQCRKFLR